MAVARGIRFCRAENLVCYWEHDHLVLHNYLTGKRAAAGPALCGVIDFFSKPRKEDEFLQAYSGVNRQLLRRSLRRLERLSFIERTEQRSRKDRSPEGWGGWNPAAGFFHFSTRDANYVEDAGFGPSEVRDGPPPLRVKRYQSPASVELPSPDYEQEFARILLARRTWRQFSADAIGLRELGALLGLTFAVHWWVDLGTNGKVALKTYPSGGACHPLEVYVVAPRVESLKPGVYHYDCEKHVLELLHRGATPRQIARYLPAQPWYGSAAALILITSIFQRVQWRYPGARAYRTVLIEAGHACQTFCLVATWLRLASFCTMALAESKIETDLGLDPTRESVLYAAGVAPQPPGISWAPLPLSAHSPQLRRMPVIR